MRLRQLGRFTLERGNQLPKPPVERLEPALGSNDVLARRLPGVAGLARRLLRGPVALLRGPDCGAPGVLRFAERVQCRLGCSCGAARLPERRTSRLLASSVRCHHQGARTRAKLVVLLLVLGLEGQPPHLRLQLRDQVADPGEIVAGLPEPDGCLVAADLEALHAGGLLEQLATFLGAQRERRIHRPLPHDHQLVRPQPALAEEPDDVAQARPGTVDQVLALTGPIRAATDGDLREVDRQPAVAVVEGQDRLGHAQALALLGSGKDDVVGATGAERSV